MKKLFFLTLLVLFGAVGCSSLPETRVETTDTRPQLLIKGAPENSVLLVDGLRMGQANNFNGDPNVLRVEPGTHVISIVSVTGSIIHKQRVFLESEIRTITVLGF